MGLLASVPSLNFARGWKAPLGLAPHSAAPPPPTPAGSWALGRSEHMTSCPQFAVSPAVPSPSTQWILFMPQVLSSMSFSLEAFPKSVIIAPLKDSNLQRRCSLQSAASCRRHLCREACSCHPEVRGAVTAARGPLGFLETRSETFPPSPNISSEERRRAPEKPHAQLRRRNVLILKVRKT